MEEKTIVSEIVSWATEKIRQEEVPDLRLGFKKSVAETTKLYLSQYLLRVASDWEKRRRILMFNEALIKSLIADVIGKDEEIKKVNERLEQMEDQKREDEDTTGNGKESGEASSNDKALERPEPVVIEQSREELIKSLIFDVIGKDEEIKKVNERLESMRDQKPENEDDTGNRKESGEASSNNKPLERPEALVVDKSREELIKSLIFGVIGKDEEIKKVNEGLEWMRDQKREDEDDTGNGKESGEASSNDKVLKRPEALVVDKSREELIKSLIVDVTGNNEEIKQVNERPGSMRDEKRQNEEDTGNRKESGEASSNDKALERPEALVVEESRNERANEGLSYRNRSLRELAPLIFGSISKILSDRHDSGAGWEKKYENMQKEKPELTGKYRAMYNEFKRALRRYNNDQGKFDERSASFEKYINEIIRENNALLAQAAQNGGKSGEFIGDYGKREHYQVAKEYKAFCLHQGIEFLADEITTWEQQRNGDRYDRRKHTEEMINRKVGLSENLLVKPYKMQVQKLRTGKQQTGFDEFSKEMMLDMLANMEFPDDKRKEFMVIAEKAFDLIKELVNLTPPCQLLLAEPGDVFNAEEHDVDDMYCQPKGVVKATVVPGLYMGHQILMKPVVVTEPIEDRDVVG